MAADETTTVEVASIGWKCDDLIPNLCSDLEVTKGRVEIHGRKLSIQYWVYYTAGDDDENDSNNRDRDEKKKYPIIVVNGGGGTPHNYDLPLRQLACREGGGRPVIFYDQGGSGMSAIPNGTTLEDDYPFLMDISYLANEELSALVQHLNLTKFHLVGDSFGTMIAMQYAIFSLPESEAEDNALVSMTLDSPIPSSKEYVERNWDPIDGTIGTMPKYFKQRFQEIAAAGDFDSEEYEQLQQVLETHFSVRNGIIPDCYYDAAMAMNIDIHLGMLGPGEGFLNWTGTLRGFDVYPYLSQPNIQQLPILLTSGGYDVVRPGTVAKMHSMLPLSETMFFPESGHATIADATEELLHTISDFIYRVERDENDFLPKVHIRTTHQDTIGIDDESDNSSSGSFLLLSGIIIAAAVGLLVGILIGRRSVSKRNEYQQVDG